MRLGSPDVMVSSPRRVTGPWPLPSQLSTSAKKSRADDARFMASFDRGANAPRSTKARTAAAVNCFDRDPIW
jgi:hypothetical protein